MRSIRSWGLAVLLVVLAIAIGGCGGGGHGSGDPAGDKEFDQELKDYGSDLDKAERERVKALEEQKRAGK